MHLHILGICGTLMGSIAQLAKEQGLKVSGTDENVYPPMSTQLEQAGITLASPYSAENIPTDADLVMVGNANLPRGNPAVEHVLQEQIPYISGAEWLGRYLLNDKWVIAISGTHGKTTTTSMVAWISKKVATSVRKLFHACNIVELPRSELSGYQPQTHYRIRARQFRPMGNLRELLALSLELPV